jgi:hypothetical protein
MFRFYLTLLEDGQWEARCYQLPHLFAIEDSAEEALEAIQDYVEDDLEDDRSGYQIVVIDDDVFSGDLN